MGVYVTHQSSQSELFFSEWLITEYIKITDYMNCKLFTRIVNKA